jgi:hypothetical protein
VTCCCIALALGLVAAGLHEAEAGAARALEQELHALLLPWIDLLSSDRDLDPLLRVSFFPNDLPTPIPSGWEGISTITSRAAFRRK